MNLKLVIPAASYARISKMNLKINFCQLAGLVLLLLGTAIPCNSFDSDEPSTGRRNASERDTLNLPEDLYVEETTPAPVTPVISRPQTVQQLDRKGKAPIQSSSGLGDDSSFFYLPSDLLEEGEEGRLPSNLFEEEELPSDLLEESREEVSSSHLPEEREEVNLPKDLLEESREEEKYEEDDETIDQGHIDPSINLFEFGQSSASSAAAEAAGANSSQTSFTHYLEVNLPHLRESYIEERFRGKPGLNEEDANCLETVLDMHIKTFRFFRLEVAARCKLVMTDELVDNLFHYQRGVDIFINPDVSRCEANLLNEADDVISVTSILTNKVIVKKLSHMIKTQLNRLFEICFARYGNYINLFPTEKVPSCKYLVDEIRHQFSTCRNRQELQNFFFKTYSAENEERENELENLVFREDATEGDIENDRVKIVDNLCNHPLLNVKTVMHPIINSRIRRIVDWEHLRRERLRICSFILNKRVLTRILIAFGYAFKRQYLKNLPALESLFDLFETDGLNVLNVYLLRNFCKGISYWSRIVNMLQIDVKDESQLVKLRPYLREYIEDDGETEFLDKHGREKLLVKFKYLTRNNELNECIIGMLDKHSSNDLLVSKLERICKTYISRNDLHMFMLGRNALSINRRTCRLEKIRHIIETLINVKLIQNPLLKRMISDMLRTTTVLRHCFSFMNRSVLEHMSKIEQQVPTMYQMTREINSYLSYDKRPLTRFEDFLYQSFAVNQPTNRKHFKFVMREPARPGVMVVRDIFNVNNALTLQMILNTDNNLTFKSYVARDQYTILLICRKIRQNKELVEVYNALEALIVFPRSRSLEGFKNFLGTTTSENYVHLRNFFFTAVMCSEIDEKTRFHFKSLEPERLNTLQISRRNLV